MHLAGIVNWVFFSAWMDVGVLSGKRELAYRRSQRDSVVCQSIHNFVGNNGECCSIV